MKKLLAVLSLLLPWSLRRSFLNRVMRYNIHPTARIGRSWIFPDYLEMQPGARIGSFTVCKGISRLVLCKSARVGNLNWITGFPADDASFFASQPDRKPELIVHEHAAITNRHLIDCTDSVTIGRFTTFAGFRSQILTHSIDLEICRQVSKPVIIGDYCFVGTGSIILAGAVLPNHSVLGAGSVLNKQYTESYQLYAGNPARPVKPLREGMSYFNRSEGFVR